MSLDDSPREDPLSNVLSRWAFLSSDLAGEPLI
jgi:hypothetical protein